MSFSDYDKSSRPTVANEDLEQAKFLKTILDRVAVRIGNEPSSPLYTSQSTAGVKAVEFAEISSLTNGVQTNIISYTVPASKTLQLEGIEVSGTNIAEYEIEIDGAVKGKKRTYFGSALNADFDFGSFEITEGKVVRVKVIHNRPMVGDFNATILGALL